MDLRRVVKVAGLALVGVGRAMRDGLVAAARMKLYLRIPVAAFHITLQR